MAYSDYGGYAFRNGRRIVDRSDAVLTDRAFTVPGTYPGFAFAAQGIGAEEGYKLRNESPNGHVVLGDGRLHVGLYKSYAVTAWLDGREIDLLSHGVDLPEALIARENSEGKPIAPALNPVDWAEGNVDREVAAFAFPDGSRLEVLWVEEDNLYIYARLAQPDGTVWAGWSGYGVGAGLEDCGYGYSTEERNRRLVKLWPEAIRTGDPEQTAGDPAAAPQGSQP